MGGLVPLLYAVEGEPPARVFGYAWLQGLACYVASLYWIAITLHTSPSVRIAYRGGADGAAGGRNRALHARPRCGPRRMRRARLRIPIVITLPIAWTAIEWLRSYFPVGFPWNLLGYAAYRNLQLIQFAEFTGVYGVSALIVFFNAVVYVVLFRLSASACRR